MRLIDADALMGEVESVLLMYSQFNHWLTKDMYTRMKIAVRAMPTVDAEPVRHGKWIEIVTHNGCTPDYDCVCSLCESSGAPIDDYCRGCGAKMDGE